jgi:hypothetical protein
LNVIAIAIFDGVEELDFVGPWQVLSGWRLLYPDDVDVHLVSDNTEPVTRAQGMRVLPERTWDDLGDIDLLVYPGGQGTRAHSATNASAHDCELSANAARYWQASARALSSSPMPDCSTAYQPRPTGTPSTSCCHSDEPSNHDRMTASSTPAPSSPQPASPQEST